MDHVYVDSHFKSKLNHFLSKCPKQGQSILPSLSRVYAWTPVLTVEYSDKLLATPGTGTKCVLSLHLFVLLYFLICFWVLFREKSMNLVALADAVNMLHRHTGIVTAVWLRWWHSPAPDERCVTIGMCRSIGGFSQASFKRGLAKLLVFDKPACSITFTPCIMWTADPTGKVLRSHLWFSGKHRSLPAFYDTCSMKAGHEGKKKFLFLIFACYVYWVIPSALNSA